MSTTKREIVPVRPHRKTLRRMLATIAIFVAAIAVAVAATGSTYALWNGSTPVQGATISTGTTGLTVNGVTDYTVAGLTFTQLLPGRSIVSPQPFIVKNTGTIPLSVTVGATAFADPAGVLASSGNLAITLIQSTSCATPADGSTPAAWTAPLVMSVGQTVSVCLQVALSANAPSSAQGATANFTVTLNADQVHA